MSGSWLESSIARRWFLARLGAGVGVLGATAVGSSTAMAQSSAGAPWKPARHSQDDWLEKIPGQHRFVFDTTTPDGLALGFQFAANSKSVVWYRPDQFKKYKLKIPKTWAQLDKVGKSTSTATSATTATNRTPRRPADGPLGDP